MKVWDLQCSQGHSFEGWFGSQEDYDAQQARGLLTCPLCNDTAITKLLSAPRLNLGYGAADGESASDNAAQAHRHPHGPAQAHAQAQAKAQNQTQTLSDTAFSAQTPLPANLPADVRGLQQLQAAMLTMVRHVMAHTEDVGSQFAEEARKIHYGEKAERNIRGQATREETEALIEEGIEVVALPIPESLKGPLQ
jgi:hypothetical protein